MRKILSHTSHRMHHRPPHRAPVRDPDLFAIAEIAHRRRLNTEWSLDSVFEKVKPILQRKPELTLPSQACELPAELKARVAAMPDPEQRIRAIVEFKLSAIRQSSYRD